MTTWGEMAGKVAEVQSVPEDQQVDPNVVVERSDIQWVFALAENFVRTMVQTDDQPLARLLDIKARMGL